jgi:hypothetical protein
VIRSSAGWPPGHVCRMRFRCGVRPGGGRRGRLRGRAPRFLAFSSKPFDGRNIFVQLAPRANLGPRPKAGTCCPVKPAVAGSIKRPGRARGREDPALPGAFPGRWSTGQPRRSANAIAGTSALPRRKSPPLPMDWPSQPHTGARRWGT